MRSAEDFRASSSQSRVPRLLALGAVVAAGMLARRSTAPADARDGGARAERRERDPREARDPRGGRDGRVARPAWADDLVGADGMAQPVSALMTRGVHTLESDDTLARAARGMRDAGVGSLPVCQGGRIVGIVTDRDLVVRGMADGRDAATTRVGDVMTHDVLVAHEDERLRDVVERMGRRQVRRVPVVDRQERLAGMLALGDVAVRSSARTDRVLEEVSRPAPEEAARG